MSTESNTAEEQHIPTKEELIAALKEQIEVKSIQLELQEINEKIAKSIAGEYQAMQFVAQMKSPQKPAAQEHTITQEDLDNNPELADQGFSVGDEVFIPEEEIAAPKERKLKRS
jgi:hypothetical protein